MSGGGGSGSDGGGDMQVSGMEAAVSQEKGISTHADTRVSRDSFSPGVGPSEDRGGVHDTRPALGYAGVTPTNVGINPNTGKLEQESNFYSGLDNEQQREYDQAKSISQGTITIDPVTGEEKPGRYRTNPNTGELERTDLSFSEHWANRPDNIKWSPTLSLLWAGGKNIGEWFKNWGSTTSNITPAPDKGDGMSERQRMNVVAPHAPYIVSGTTAPSTSPAANWFQNLGTTSTNMGGFNLATEYAAAKTKVAKTLNTPTAVGQLAVNQSPFYNWLQTNSLNKGIL